MGISFSDPAVTSNFRRIMNGFQLQSRRSLKEITVEPAHVQGFFGSARNLASARVAVAAGDDMKIIYKHECRNIFHCSILVSCYAMRGTSKQPSRGVSFG